MAPKPQVTARDLVSRDMSPAAKDIFDRALVKSYYDQQKLLKKAAQIK